MEKATNTASNPEKKAAGSYIDQIKQRKNPDYVEEIEGGRVEAWFKVGSDLVYAVCYSEAVDNGSWWGEELKDISTSSLPEDESERYALLVDSIRTRLEDEEALTSLLQRMTIDNSQKNQKQSTSRTSRRLHHDPPQLPPPEQLSQNSQEKLLLAYGLAEELELPQLRVVDMQLYELGEPVHIQADDVYLHGLEDPHSGVSLAVKYNRATDQWFVAQPTEAERITYNYYQQQRSEHQNLHWVLQINSAWRRIQADQLQYLIREKLQAQDQRVA